MARSDFVFTEGIIIAKITELDYQEKLLTSTPSVMLLDNKNGRLYIGNTEGHLLIYSTEVYSIINL